jgi:hypothetical protein
MDSIETVNHIPEARYAIIESEELKKIIEMDGNYP